MLEFTKIERVYATKRPANVRKKDYGEIYNLFDKKLAAEQGSRCVQCGDPYCHNRCPLHNLIPNWLKQVADKDLELAFLLSNETSPFPEILGKICPHDSLCEGDCTLNDGHGAIAIGSIETYISEKGFEKGLKPKFSAKKCGKKVAVIGSGPAGMSAATFLLRKGFDVDMFEREDRAGGLLMYGIPGFKLDKKDVQRRIDWLVEAGMKLHLQCEIGRDISFEEIEKNYDAVFLGIGATKGKKAGMINEDAINVHTAMEFLTKIQKRNLGDKINYIDVKNRDVVVIGGGDTAMDCVRTSIREGAKSVKCLYRRDEANMPGSKKEVVNAKEEGAEFIFNVSPKAIVERHGIAKGVELQKTALSEPDAKGRRSVVLVEGSEYIEKADVVLCALGFDQEIPPFLKSLNLDLDATGRIKTDEFLQTSNPKIYAGGDCKRGAELAVTATYDGRTAAYAIAQKLLA